MHWLILLGGMYLGYLFGASVVLIFVSYFYEHDQQKQKEER